MKAEKSGDGVRITAETEDELEHLRSLLAQSRRGLVALAVTDIIKGDREGVISFTLNP